MQLKSENDFELLTADTSTAIGTLEIPPSGYTEHVLGWFMCAFEHTSILVFLMGLSWLALLFVTGGESGCVLVRP